MSMNILITATRKITFKKKNGRRGSEIQTVKFREWQTPTKITHEILASKDPAQAYIDWILRDCSIDVETPVFAEDDIWEEGKPVDIKIFNAGKEHVEEFREWIKSVEEDGFTLKFEMI
jgi:hypothetical protein